MNLVRAYQVRPAAGVPRASGDEPQETGSTGIGFTVFPAPAGMNRA